MKTRTLVRSAIVLAGVACVAPQASALSFGTQTVSSGGQTGYGYGTASIVFTSAKINSYAKVSVLNGKGAYSSADFSSPANSAYVRSADAQTTSYKNVSNSVLFSGATYGPWTASVHTCINVPYASDPCSGRATGAA